MKRNGPCTSAVTTGRSTLLRLVAGAPYLATVRTQVDRSLVTDFEQFTTCAPAERHGAVLQRPLTAVIAWTDARSHSPAGLSPRQRSGVARSAPAPPEPERERERERA